MLCKPEISPSHPNHNKTVLAVVHKHAHAHICMSLYEHVHAEQA